MSRPVTAFQFLNTARTSTWCPFAEDDHAWLCIGGRVIGQQVGAVDVLCPDERVAFDALVH
jgi:hypothetical protein